MGLSFCSFSSGSSGNCYLVKSESAAVLVDAGISARKILKELDRTDTPHESVKALFLTHEHHDHVKGARVLLKRLAGADVYASGGTMEGAIRRDAGKKLSFAKEIAERRRVAIGPDCPVKIGDLTVRAFRTLHDAAEPYGYSIASGEKRIAILADTGMVTEEMLHAVADADVLVLEANHDTEILRHGHYPHFLKQRILSEHGHLSNAQAADALLRLFSLTEKKRVVLLAHLSHENNTPVIAERTVLTALAREGRYTGSDLYMGVLLREEASLLYRL
ncbi:MAG: MBL fold metallo-hydrolase [Clostridiales bacterium]|nr:MBL fold metallo-hydrolase [Clostridiales bacterium]